MINSYDEMIQRIVKWSESRPMLLASIMVGSRARETNEVDALSDLDLILISDSPSELVRSENWISTISRPWILDYTHTFAGDAEWQVIYEGGFKVDFVITTSGNSGDITQVLEGSPYQEVFNHGWKQLHFKPNLTTERSSQAGTSMISIPRKISAKTQLSHAIFLSYGLAKSIFRNDLWRAHNYLCQLRDQVTWFIEINARLDSSDNVGKWDCGRNIDGRVRQELIKQLPSLFPGYDRESLVQSFHFALDLLEDLALNVSISTGKEVPSPGQQAAVNWLKEIVSL